METVGDGPLVRIVQPNTTAGREVAARESRRTGRQAGGVEPARRLRQAGGGDLAGDGAPFIVEPGSAALEVMARAVPPGGYLLTGAARGTGNREDGVWNALLVIDGRGQIVAKYDKVHLVPLGEYIPFHKQLAPVSGFIGRGSFEVGESRVTLDLPRLPSLLADHLLRGDLPGRRHRPGARPRWLLNVTNDAWFGLSSGPYQHLGQCARSGGGGGPADAPRR